MKLELTEEEVIQIGAALGELPFKEVAALVNKIQAQFNDRQAKED